MNHLGGHNGTCWDDEGALTYLHNNLNIKSMVDVGCGMGCMSKIAKKLDITWLGIDGDPKIPQVKDLLRHDFQNGPCPDMVFDLGYSTEFLEHVKEEYMENFLPAFIHCKFLLVTAAPPGFGGHHHVNEQPKEYWVEFFNKYGFEHDEETMEEIRKHSTMRRNPMRQHSFMVGQGMFYRKNK